jgi:hypothetical protein
LIQSEIDAKVIDEVSQMTAGVVDAHLVRRGETPTGNAQRRKAALAGLMVAELMTAQESAGDENR